MDYLASQPQFNSLSISELLKARDQFHPHLMHKANVIGTAIGRYLIRKTDPYPKHEVNDQENKRNKAGSKQKITEKPPRTLENSEVRDYSWPCILVFVSQWEDDSLFNNKDLSMSTYVPKTVYLEDGQSVPICLVLAPPVETAPPPLAAKSLIFPKDYLSGGYPVSVTVQKEERVASLGCLVTDGHTMYALTNRHVTGEPGEKMYSYLAGKKTQIGVSSDKQIVRLPFEKLYDSWPGKKVYVNMDIGLIRIDNFNDWQPTVYGLGEIGPLADLSIYNITLNLIGCPVQSYGCAGGSMFGHISALFYRYKSVGGFDYVADFLIGSRTNQPLNTRPGDSGSLIVMESDNIDLALQPLAVQWGGAVFSENSNSFPFILATNLSNICRELGVDLFRSRNLASFDYWGAVNHYAIGSYACELIEDKKLKNLMKLNQTLISFATDDIDKSVNDVKVPGFVQLADVPDKVWKNPFSKEKSPYGRKGRENPNHYADIDYGSDTVPGHNIPVKSLDARTPKVADLTTQKWRDYYNKLGWKNDRDRGCVPFRIWQIYKEMVRFVQKKDIASFVTAAGIIAHYVGDTCQPLHGSYLDDGDPWRTPDGEPANKKQEHGKGFAGGVHHFYEASMIDQNVEELTDELDKLIGKKHGMKLIKGGSEAGFAAIELMRRSQKTLPPMDIVEKYGQIRASGQNHQISKLLWQSFGKQTIAVTNDGCRTLAMIWDSAWKEGGGANIDAASIHKFQQKTLKNIYENQDFLPSVALDNIDQFL
jgi:hypothetical protein